MSQPSNILLFYFALYTALATLAGAASYQLTPRYFAFKFGFALVAFALLLVAVLMLSRWFDEAWSWHQYQSRQREITTPAIEFAKAIRLLSPEQLSLLARYQTIESQGIISNGGVLWSFVGLKGKNIPVDWAGRYLELSQDSAPELYPVRGREGDSFWSWEDTELARAFTDLLVAHGFALPAAGRRPAVLKIDLPDLADLLNLGA